ncbi:hypothetical protein TrCOL_g425 [Triparma columacea]|uniref:phosphoribosylaminoimidazole carboxylase n=1 Tax=Triparma columacea TaxID=722753 RepID=A0A9W7LC84_9STRA|nr:hypothetical protein TrCOL_g425 [Triparma columacea]
MNASNPPVIGIIGGGQLGRMMALEAPRLSLRCKVLDAGGAKAPCAGISEEGYVEGGLKDSEKLKELAKGCDVVTAEIEHISVPALEELESLGVNVQPPSSVFKTIQDKLVQKDHFAKAGVALPRYMDTPNVEAVKRAAEEFGLPLMLKSRKEGYDGRGNCVLKSIEDAQKAFDTVNNPGGVYAEGWVDFVDELAVMVVRSTTGESKCYPTVSAIQRDSVCRIVVAPARAPESSRLLAQLTAKSAIDSMPGATGVFGVELFICRDGSVLLNEVAPRPHNTGHYTQDACACSQFENHLRAVSGMELGGTDLIVGAAGMVNVLGTGDMEGTTAALKLAMSMERAAVHWYGKAPAKLGRKMGHINITADSPAEMEKDLKALMDAVGLTMEGEGKGGDVFPPPPLVGVIMGSDSDLPCMSAACSILKEFGVHFEVDIVSAHRTPVKMTEYAKEAAGRGVEVIIAGAGGAAHLPGMVASMTPLPVVGVPIKTSTLSGVDSLHSIVQMPRGIPVATVAIGNAQNAGLLAVRILASTRKGLREKMEAYQRGMKEVVEGKSERLKDIGYEKYVEGMGNKGGTVNV